MACFAGSDFSITLADDGSLYGFGQLGSGIYDMFIAFPFQIPNLPKITKVSCALHFTICIDEDGCAWTFGEDFNFIPNTTQNKIPQQIQDVPSAKNVSCGAFHALITTGYEDLWSMGKNNYGQLCLENKNSQSTPKKTSFSNISMTAAGYFHSLFQNFKGEIFGCGLSLDFNTSNEPQIEVCLLPNLSPNIVDFSCGFNFSLFLDSEGNVFSHGEQGFGNNASKGTLRQIPNIPPIQKISCVVCSNYLLDMEGYVWSFGLNNYEQLGHPRTIFQRFLGYGTSIDVPKKIPLLSNIQQISSGFGSHFFAKDNQNKIFALGKMMQDS